MEQIKGLIQGELLVLVPVLYLIGTGIKRTKKIKDKYIPLLLGTIGIICSCLYLKSISFGGITQGILCAGAAVYANQLIKQGGKT